MPSKPVFWSIALVFAALGVALGYILGHSSGSGEGLLAELWAMFSDFSNSAFITAALTAGAGAWAGAAAAQRIAENKRLEDDLLKEIRNTNAVISVAFGIANAGLAMKGQHTKALKERYDEQSRRIGEALRARTTGPLHFNADMQTLQTLKLPIERLQDMMIERLSISGRALLVLFTLSQVARALDESLSQRNELIESYKNRFPQSNDEFLALYFGLPFGTSVNQDYPTTLDAICSYVDDVIFFGKLLCEDAREHGLKVVDQYRRAFKRPPPRVQEADFTKGPGAGLVPDEKNYVNWTGGFVKVPDPAR